MAYDIIMIATFIDDEYIDRLLNSVVVNNRSVDILIIVVDQTCSKCLFRSDNTRVRIHRLHQKSLIPLSRARNAALEFVMQSGIVASHVMFPDDDALFDSPFFYRYGNVVQTGRSYLIVAVNEENNEPYRRFPLEDGQRLDRRHYQYSMSINMILSMEAVVSTGYFDERLGVGANYGACEDWDYYLRACRHTPFEFSKALHVYHPSIESAISRLPMGRVLARYKSYSKAFIFFAYRHRMFWEIPKSVGRALVASGYLCLARQFKRSVAQLYAAVVRSLYACAFLVKRRELFLKDWHDGESGS
ncbi:MAG: hypothetical protein V1792_09885 [Pseudomonadota bacterium]